MVKKFNKILVMSNSIFILLCINLVIQNNILLSSLNDKESAYKELNNTYASLSTNYTKLLQDFNDKQAEYDSLMRIAERQSNELYQLEAQVSNLSEENAQLRFNYSIRLSQINNSINSLKSDLLAFETSINESLNWLQKNNNLANTTFDLLKKDLEQECLEINSEYCDIKAHCIYFVNTHDSFTHKLTYLSEPEDALINITYMYDYKRGGDCEDWSLLFKAEYNYLRDLCNNKHGIPNERVRLIYSTAGAGKCYLDKSKIWYYSNCDEVIVTGKPYMSIACYAESEKAGHCIVALTEHEILNSTIVYTELSNAEYVEPQGGSGITTTLFLYNNKNDVKYLPLVFYVISDSDLYSFYYIESDEWKGYHDFYLEVQNLLDEINNIKLPGI